MKRKDVEYNIHMAEQQYHVPSLCTCLEKVAVSNTRRLATSAMEVSTSKRMVDGGARACCSIASEDDMRSALLPFTKRFKSPNVNSPISAAFG